jgi:hypothetical protein
VAKRLLVCLVASYFLLLVNKAPLNQQPVSLIPVLSVFLFL